MLLQNFFNFNNFLFCIIIHNSIYLKKVNFNLVFDL